MKNLTHLSKKYDYDTEKNSSSFLIQKKYRLIKERRDEILKSSENINCDNSGFHYQDKSICERSFNNFTDAAKIFKKIRSSEIMLEKEKENQNEFKSSLTKIRTVKRKLDEQKSELDNIETLFNLWHEVIKVYDGYSSLISETKPASFHGKGLKILTPKQMLQRLSIALAQGKAGNTSENLLNEILQIIYSLYRTKEITKRVCNKTNSIKLSNKNGYYIYEF